MSRVKDLTGQVFSRLTVLRLSHIDAKQNAQWVCRCECGSESTVRGFQLTGGTTRSCGCLQREVASMCGNRPRPPSVRKVRSPERNAWVAMISRCTNPANKAYKDYGGRGITVSEEWGCYENFIRDMGSRPSSKHSIERINNDRGYSKENCKWATRAEQSRNHRRNRYIDTTSGRMLICDASRLAGISQLALRSRVDMGWKTEDLFKPVKKYRERKKIAQVN